MTACFQVKPRASIGSCWTDQKKSHRILVHTSFPPLQKQSLEKGERKEVGSDESNEKPEITAPRRKFTGFQGYGSATIPSRWPESGRWKATRRKGFPPMAAAATATRGE